MLSINERDILKRNLTNYEGRTNHMYLCSNGFVTVGVGHMMPTSTEAEKLPFKNATNRNASQEEIRSEYEAVAKLPPNRVSSYYKKHTTLVLPDHEIDRLTNAHIETFHSELRLIYSEFDSFPSEARLALFDMIFNLGMTNLRSTWPSMNAAIQEQDWAGAAEHSRRAPPVSTERNRYVRELFEKAAEDNK